MSQVKDSAEPPEAERGRAGISPRTFERGWPSWHLRFRILACRTGENTYLSSATQFVAVCYGCPRKLAQPRNFRLELIQRSELTRNTLTVQRLVFTVGLVRNPVSLVKPHPWSNNPGHLPQPGICPQSTRQPPLSLLLPSVALVGVSHRAPSSPPGHLSFKALNPLVSFSKLKFIWKSN